MQKQHVHKMSTRIKYKNYLILVLRKYHDYCIILPQNRNSLEYAFNERVVHVHKFVSPSKRIQQKFDAAFLTAQLTVCQSLGANRAKKRFH